MYSKTKLSRVISKLNMNYRDSAGSGDSGGVGGFGGGGREGSGGGSDWDGINSEIESNGLGTSPGGSDYGLDWSGSIYDEIVNGPLGDSLSGYAGLTANEQLGYEVTPERQSAPGYGFFDMVGDYWGGIPTAAKLAANFMPYGNTLMGSMTGLAALANYLGYEVGPGEISESELFGNGGSTHSGQNENVSAVSKQLESMEGPMAIDINKVIQDLTTGKSDSNIRAKIGNQEISFMPKSRRDELTILLNYLLDKGKTDAAIAAERPSTVDKASQLIGLGSDALGLFSGLSKLF